MALEYVIADVLNIEMLHEHLFFDDTNDPKDNIGFRNNRTFKELSKNGYHRRDKQTYDDCIMREAVKQVTPPTYSLIGFGSPKYNCQDYASSLRAKYHEIKDKKEIKCKCKKKQRSSSLLFVY